MRHVHERRPSWRRIACSVGLLTTIGITGCQVDIGGQTLPSPNYQSDDIQYFPPGPEFKLSREAAVQKAFKEEQEGQAP